MDYTLPGLAVELFKTFLRCLSLARPPRRGFIRSRSASQLGRGEFRERSPPRGRYTPPGSHRAPAPLPCPAGSCNAVNAPHLAPAKLAQFIKERSFPQAAGSCVRIGQVTHPPEFADTDPRAMEAWLNLLRSKSSGERMMMVLDLSDLAIRMSEAGVRADYPQASEREVFLRAAARRLPRDLMIRAYGCDPADDAHSG